MKAAFSHLRGLITITQYRGQSSTNQTARLEAFSDGVFTIAITLPTLEIKVPSANTTNLTAELAHQGAVAVRPLARVFVACFWAELVAECSS